MGSLWAAFGQPLGSLWVVFWQIYSLFIFLDYNSACWKKTDKGDKFQSGSMISGPKYCGDPPEPNPNEIRLMSYNLFGGGGALQDPEKTENLYRIIRAFNPGTVYRLGL